MVTLNDRHSENGNLWDKNDAPEQGKYADIAVHGACGVNGGNRFLVPVGQFKRIVAWRLKIPYKEKALRTGIGRLESCEGSDVTGASSQGVEANRCVALSRSRYAVGWCQWPAGSPSPSDGTTDANNESRHASIRFRSEKSTLNSVFCKNWRYNRKNLYLAPILTSNFCICQCFSKTISQNSILNIIINNEIFCIFACYSK